MQMNEFGRVPMVLLNYLQKQVLGWVWSVESRLLPSAIEKRTCKNIRARMFTAESFETNKSKKVKDLT